MKHRNLIFLFASGLLLIGFGWGVVELFKLRFAMGDVYPAYSSLRADPLGTKALHESFRQLPLQVERNYKPWRRMEGSPSALLVLGLEHEDLDQATSDEIQDADLLLSEGHRLVLSFLPVTGKTNAIRRKEKRTRNMRAKDSEDDSTEKKKEDSEEEKKSDVESKKKLEPASGRKGALQNSEFQSLAKHWGFGVNYTNLVVNARNQPIPAEVSAAEGTGGKPISWHTAIYFDHLNAPWHVIYKRGEWPVIIERSWGKGSIVLSSDSYFFSNEAMRKERHPDLLLWMLGGHKRVIFDEAHFGVQEQPGISSLLLKYRLQGFVAAILLLAILFVWKNAFSFVPPHEEPEHVSSEGGERKNDSAGFVNLLRRNISDADLSAVCFEEWAASTAPERRLPAADLQRIREEILREQSLPKRERNPISTYNNIRQILTERKTPWSM